MTLYDERHALTARLKTWPRSVDAGGPVPIHWEGVSFDPPENSQGVPLPYVSMVILRSVPVPLTLGSGGLVSRPGFLNLVINWPRHREGMGLAEVWAQEILDLFESQQFGIVRMERGFLLRLDPDDCYEKILLRIAFERYTGCGIAPPVVPQPIDCP